jgi:hypothetical protein
VSSAYLNISPSPKLWIGCLLLISGSLITWRSVTNPLGSSQEPSNPR